jgi:cytochrome c peroxidase
LTGLQRDPTTFTDNDFHNIGIGIIRHDVVALARRAEQAIDSGDTAAVDRAAIQTDLSALGRFLIIKRPSDIAAFKTPDLRNLLMTAPHFFTTARKRRCGMSSTTTTRGPG